MAVYEFYFYDLTVTGSIEDQRRVYDLLVNQGDIIGPQNLLISAGPEDSPFSLYSCPDEFNGVEEWYEPDQEEVLHKIALQVPNATLILEAQNENDSEDAFKKRFHGELYQERRFVAHIPEFTQGGDVLFEKRKDIDFLNAVDRDPPGVGKRSSLEQQLKKAQQKEGQFKKTSNSNLER